MSELDPQDVKIVTLARAARARVAASGGAAVRDTTGRTYASADVTLGDMALSATLLAVAQAVASGAEGIEAVAVDGVEPTPADLAAIAAAGGTGVPVLVIDPAGQVARVVHA